MIKGPTLAVWGSYYEEKGFATTSLTLGFLCCAETNHYSDMSLTRSARHPRLSAARSYTQIQRLGILDGSDEIYSNV